MYMSHYTKNACSVVQAGKYIISEGNFSSGILSVRKGLEANERVHVNKN